jgi:hypothetical protein
MKIRRIHSGIRCENINEEEYLRDLDIDGRLLLKSNLET